MRARWSVARGRVRELEHQPQLALQPELRWWISWPLTSVGIVCADIVLYSIGRYWGERLFQLRWVRLVLKPERRQRDVDVAYVGFRIPDEFVVGYGLDYAEKYRNLRDICVLDPD